MAESQTNGKVKLVNLAPWPVSFGRKLHEGSVRIPANGIVPMEREEVEAQLYDNNVLMLGTDGHGAHAHIFIDDKAIREQFEIPDDQLVMTDDVLDKLFAYKTQAAFEKNVSEYVVRNYEAHRIVDYIKRKKVNDFAKVRFVESFTGITVN